MNIRLYTSAVIATAVLASCGGPVQSDNELERLMAKRDSLKNELAIINEQIALLDTAKEVLIPIVTSSAVEQKDFVHKVEVQGSVETDENVVLTAESQGVIRTIHVKEGQKVITGASL
jgi:membrane fusion protein (multidrug efflux system)